MRYFVPIVANKEAPWRSFYVTGADIIILAVDAKEMVVALKLETGAWKGLPYHKVLGSVAFHARSVSACGSPLVISSSVPYRYGRPARAPCPAAPAVAPRR